VTAVEDQGLEALLAYVAESRGVDLTGYKRPTLSRRIRKRMEEVGARTFEEYRDRLEVDPDEFPALFNTILINVTGFFRDRATWDYVAEEILPVILAREGAERPVRVWCPGCASGEEAFTVAMLLAERMGSKSFRGRVKIYATDVDEDALATARQASYTRKRVEDVPEELRQKYFEARTSRFVVRPLIRQSVIFGQHNLAKDAPISHLDLIICRNTLMYFNTELQNRILVRMNYALEEYGYLLLGRAELLVTFAHLFTPVAIKHRVFRKVPRPGLPGPIVQPPPAIAVETIEAIGRQVQLREAALKKDPFPLIVIDGAGIVSLINDAARASFGLRPQDTGRLFQDLRLSFQPVELRGPIETVTTERRTITIPDIHVPGPDGQPRVFDAILTPVEMDDQLLGVSITFVDETRDHEMRVQLERSKQELEAAYQELQSTNSELETTNEEFQSTVEELETTNEELQSSNEEMETTNEELQSSNQELEAMNEEYRHRCDELEGATSFLSSLLGGLHVAVVAIDKELRVQNWNRRAQDLWGLRAEEVLGRPFFRLDIGLPVAELKDMVRDCLRGGSGQGRVVLEARNRRGETIRCRVTCTPLQDGNVAIGGAILVMDEEER
jgi:two-component system CheB/CheR fusion protein